MKLEIIVGGMDHECCGREIERYQQVRFTYDAGDDGRLYETRHPWDDSNLEIAEVGGTEVFGTVVNLEVILADGARVEIERVPGGSALGGRDPHDDGEIVALYTEEVLDESSGDFIVTLDVAR